MTVNFNNLIKLGLSFAATVDAAFGALLSRL